MTPAGPFLKNPYLLWLSIAVLAVAGWSALVSMPRLEDPRITNRFAMIVTPFPGADATRVEALVTEPIEQALRTIPEIKTVESVSRAGVSSVLPELADNVDERAAKEIRSRMRDRIAEAALPPGARRPIFEDLRGASAWTLVVFLREADGAEAGETGADEAEETASLNRLSRLSEALADRLRNLPGTELVRLYGEPEEELTVTTDPDELTALGLSPADVAAAIAGADAKRPAGTVRSATADRGLDLDLEVTGALTAAARVAAVPLLSRDGTTVRVGDVAEVSRGFQTPPGSVALTDGRRAVFVAARVSAAARTDLWATAAKEEVNAFAADVGAAATVGLVYDESVYTNARLAELAGNLLAGATVIAAVVLLMMGWRAALIVCAALPLVCGGTLFGILTLGGSLHQMSIFGFIIALGLLIDNAIVVTEEVRHRLRAGADRAEAVADASRHLLIPLAASTFTTVLAFAPIVLLDGNIGDFVGPIGVSVVLAVAGSFLVAITLTAALAAKFLPAGRDRTGDLTGNLTGGLRGVWRRGVEVPRLARSYTALLRAGARRPGLALAFSLILPACGCAAALGMGRQFFPRVDRDMFDVQLWMPAGTGLAATRDAAREVEAILRRSPGASSQTSAESAGENARGNAVEHVHWLAGASLPSVYYNLVENADGQADYARGVVVARSFEDVKALLAQAQPALDDALPDAQIVIGQFAQGPPVDAPVMLRLFGPDVATLQTLGDAVRAAVQRHPKTLHARTTMPRGVPKLWVDADEDAARLAGFSLADVADRLRADLDGVTGGSLLEDVEELPVRVRAPEASRSDLSAVASARFALPPAPAGSQIAGSPTAGAAAAPQWIPLAALGEVTLRPETGGVTRRNGVRCNQIKGYVTNDALPIEVTRDVLDALEEQGVALPAGYTLQAGGDSEKEGEAIASLARYLPVLVTLTAATVILAFRSVSLAALLGGVGTLAVALGLLSTRAFGFPLSFNTALGTAGLIGVALNDSIVVLAALRADPGARRGEIEATARVVAGTTRHILATTLTTVGGFLPLILSGGDFWPPLAVVIAGGVAGATALALGFVPAGYLLLIQLKAVDVGEPDVGEPDVGEPDVGALVEEPALA